MLNCPHCSKSISPFAPAVFGPAKDGVRLCPHCGEKFAMTIDKKVALIVGVIVSMVGFFVLRPIPGIGAPLWGGVTVCAALIAGVRLVKQDA